MIASPMPIVDALASTTWTLVELAWRCADVPVSDEPVPSISHVPLTCSGVVRRSSGGPRSARPPPMVACGLCSVLTRGDVTERRVSGRVRAMSDG
jgi:hypothetical protein